MLRSMTGFGRCVVEDADWTQTWEIRSVNNRHLDLKWKLPAQARGLESRFERVVRRFAGRGRMEIGLMLQARGSASARIRFDATQASAMLDAVAALADVHGDVYEPDYNALFAVPSLWERESEDVDEDMDARLEEGLVAALEDWNESRETEGAALAKDMESRIARMEGWLERLDERAPEIKEERFAVLRERLNDALAAVGGPEVEDGRFLQEMVIVADKLDVSEELTRLHAHLERLRDLLGMGVDAGRRLDFTLQECFREIATCGNKIQDAQVSRMVVDFKNELEKCREQVPESGITMQRERFINLGFGNFVVASRVVGIVNPASAPMRRLREDARSEGRLVDATQGRKTRSIIITDSNHVILSAILPETLGQRFVQEENNDV